PGAVRTMAAAPSSLPAATDLPSPPSAPPFSSRPSLPPPLLSSPAPSTGAGRGGGGRQTRSGIECVAPPSPTLPRKGGAGFLLGEGFLLGRGFFWRRAGFGASAILGEWNLGRAAFANAPECADGASAMLAARAVPASAARLWRYAGSNKGGVACRRWV